MTDWILNEAKALQEELVANRRWLHQHPELGLHLPETTAFVKSKLDEMGVPYQEICDSGLVVLLGKKPGKCIILRADMDALPMPDESGLPFASQNAGVAHTCGHDMHTAMMLGVVKLLKAHEEELNGTVKIVFQPGEETGAGARVMVEDGALTDPKVDAAFGLHVQPTDRTGEVGYAVGVNSASLDSFILKIYGRGGHSSQPQLCTDPLMIMNQVYQAVNLLATREADPAAMVALTCGVAKGGTAVNIIPDEAELHIGLRTLDVEAAEHLKQRIPEVIDHYVKAWNGEYDLTIFHTPCTFSNEELCREMVPHIGEIVGEENVHQIPPMTGTEDFGYVTKEVPGMFAFIGAGKPGNAPLHSPKMILDEEVLPIGAAVHANAAIAWLEEHGKENN